MKYENLPRAKELCDKIDALKKELSTIDAHSSKKIRIENYLGDYIIIDTAIEDGLSDSAENFIEELKVTYRNDINSLNNELSNL